MIIYIKNIIFREKATSALADFMQSSILIKLEIGNVGFVVGRKTRVPGEKPSQQGEKQQQTQPSSEGNGCFHHCVYPALPVITMWIVHGSRNLMRYIFAKSMCI